MKMLNPLLLTSVFALLMMDRATASWLAIDPAEGAPSQSLDLRVNLSETASLSGLQFDVEYPASLMTSDRARAGLDLPLGCLVESELISNDGETEVRRILVHSPENLMFGNGHLITVPVVIASNAPITRGPVTLSKVMAADADAAVHDVRGEESSIEVVSTARLALTYTSAGGGNAGFAVLNLSGTSGSMFQIEGSTDLAVWNTLGTVTLDDGTATFDLTPFMGVSEPQFFRGKAQMNSTGQP